MLGEEAYGPPQDQEYEPQALDPADSQAWWQHPAVFVPVGTTMIIALIAPAVLLLIKHRLGVKRARLRRDEGLDIQD